MVEEGRASIEDRPPAASGDSGIAAAVALGSASRTAADAFLAEHILLARKQAALAEVQAEEIHEEKKLRHWSMRVRHVSDVMKLAFELSVALILLALVMGIGAAVWSASHEDGLVIDAFTVPPDLAQRGVSGDVIASAVLDRLSAMQNDTVSSRSPSSYAKNWDNDIKVEIPDTGVSVGEAYRFLVSMLGHETHISGEVYRAQNGIVLVTRVSGKPGAHWQGRETNLDDLIGKAAGYVYERTQPFRYAAWLLNHGRFQEADPVFAALAKNGPESERPWAYSVWLYPALASGNLEAALERARQGAELAPNLILAQINAATVEAVAGHDEQVLRYAKAGTTAWRSKGRRDILAEPGAVMEREAQAAIAEETGGFDGALEVYREILGMPGFAGSDWQARYMMAADAVKMHDLAAAGNFLGSGSDADMTRRNAAGAGWNMINFAYPQANMLGAKGDWKGVQRDLQDVVAMPEMQRLVDETTSAIALWPQLALASAHLGDTAKAWQTIAKTSLDCYVCLRTRARIDVLAKNWSGAAYWYARAVKLAPSIPYAYSEWGQMLLAKGDRDGAIAKFSVAHQKGPHFADPLELWGEALIAQNRSDLALAKFAEAARYAPNWGRLHLKWGEALVWLGDKPGAAKQFALAAYLDLSAADKAELSRVSHV